MTSAIHRHGDHGALNGRLDLLTVTVDEFHTQLHRTADGGPPRRRQRSTVAAETMR
jgi:hypothetical protein